MLCLILISCVMSKVSFYVVLCFVLCCVTSSVSSWDTSYVLRLALRSMRYVLFRLKFRPTCSVGRGVPPSIRVHWRTKISFADKTPPDSFRGNKGENARLRLASRLRRRNGNRADFALKPRSGFLSVLTFLLRIFFLLSIFFSSFLFFLSFFS